MTPQRKEFVNAVVLTAAYLNICDKLNEKIDRLLSISLDQFTLNPEIGELAKEIKSLQDIKKEMEDSLYERYEREG